MSLYYEDDHVQLFHGDCRDEIPDQEIRADLIVTDPPYGETSLEWDQWPTGWVQTVSTAVPAATSLWCFGSMRMHLARRDEFQGWTLGQDLIWEKHNGSGFHADRFRRVHEIAVHWYRGAWSDVHHEPQYTYDARKRTVRTKARPAHMGEIGNNTYVSEDGGPRLMRSVLAVPSMHGMALHPTEKPLGILEPIIRYSAAQDAVILDPFAGSGSTLHAAKMNGRRAVGVEADERYCEIAAKRLAQGAFDFGTLALTEGNI